MDFKKKIAGTFVVADGIDCGGKGTAIATLADLMLLEGLKTFDLAKYQKDSLHVWPEKILDIDADVLITAEPPYAGGGWELRNGALQHLDKYTPHQVAEQFSSYRSSLYAEVIEPWLASGRAILQERSELTSRKYQVAQSKVYIARKKAELGDLFDPEKYKPLTIQDVVSFHGNQRAIQTPPTLLIIMLCSPQYAANRVLLRSQKQDNADFEKMDYLIEIDKAYRIGDIPSMYDHKRTQVTTIDTTNKDIDWTRREVLSAWRSYINLKK